MFIKLCDTLNLVREGQRERQAATGGRCDVGGSDRQEVVGKRWNGEGKRWEAEGKSGRQKLRGKKVMGSGWEVKAS